jgi:hypothetical protein
MIANAKTPFLTLLLPVMPALHAGAQARFFASCSLSPGRDAGVVSRQGRHLSSSLPRFRPLRRCTTPFIPSPCLQSQGGGPSTGMKA